METIWKVNKTDKDGTVHFFHTSKKTEYARVELFDTTTQTLIYIVEQEWGSRVDYYTSPGPAGKYSGNSIFRVINKDGKMVLEYPYEHEGERRLPVINGKPVYFKSNPNDVTFCTLFEVFFKLDYQGDFCKVDVNDTVVDIGGNVGVFSVFAQQMKPKHTFVVEPMKETFDYMCENLKGFDNVTTINKAISKDGGDMEFVIAHHSGCNILKNNLREVGEEIANYATLSTGESKLNTNSTTVKTITINDLIKEYNIDCIDFLKVDCEGGEKDLFETIDKNYLKNNVKKIALEYHSLEIREFIMKILIDCGFIIEKNTGGSDIGLIYAYKF
tara:strand:+ start:3954 stop:4940 length:987 start_codon:yes stop_codon:yes gene_type:complete